MDWVRKATGSAIVITNDRGEVLLMRRAYPPFDWVLPGGNAEAGESPVETATREVREETGLDIEIEEMSGVYYQADHRAGEFIHFVFRARVAHEVHLVRQASEVAVLGFYALDDLPNPMSPSTRRRLLDGLEPPAAGRLPVRLDADSEPA